MGRIITVHNTGDQCTFSEPALKFVGLNAEIVGKALTAGR